MPQTRTTGSNRAGRRRPGGATRRTGSKTVRSRRNSARSSGSKSASARRSTKSSAPSRTRSKSAGRISRVAQFTGDAKSKTQNGRMRSVARNRARARGRAEGQGPGRRRHAGGQGAGRRRDEDRGSARRSERLDLPGRPVWPEALRWTAGTVRIRERRRSAAGGGDVDEECFMRGAAKRVSRFAAANGLNLCGERPERR